MRRNTALHISLLVAGCGLSLAANAATGPDYFDDAKLACGNSSIPSFSSSNPTPRADMVINQSRSDAQNALRGYYDQQVAEIDHQLAGLDAQDDQALIAFLKAGREDFRSRSAAAAAAAEKLHLLAVKEQEQMLSEVYGKDASEACDLMKTEYNGYTRNMVSGTFDPTAVMRDIYLAVYAQEYNYESSASPSAEFVLMGDYWTGLKRDHRPDVFDWKIKRHQLELQQDQRKLQEAQAELQQDHLDKKFANSCEANPAGASCDKFDALEGLREIASDISDQKRAIHHLKWAISDQELAINQLKVDKKKFQGDGPSSSPSLLCEIQSFKNQFRIADEAERERLVVLKSPGLNQCLQRPDVTSTQSGSRTLGEDSAVRSARTGASSAQGIR